MSTMSLDDARTREARALQCYLALIGMAQNRVLPTYGMVAERVGVVPRKVGELLTCLAPWLARNRLPPLFCIVVNDKTGLPGEGFAMDLDQLPALRERVYDFGWCKIRPPSLAELAMHGENGAAAGLKAKYGNYPSKAAQIRAMARDGMRRGDIARALDAIYDTNPGRHRYQHVRGVLVRSAPGSD